MEIVTSDSYEDDLDLFDFDFDFDVSIVSDETGRYFAKCFAHKNVVLLCYLIAQRMM
jgi:hypothetical protein